MESDAKRMEWKQKRLLGCDCCPSRRQGDVDHNHQTCSPVGSKNGHGRVLTEVLDVLFDNQLKLENVNECINLILRDH